MTLDAEKRMQPPGQRSDPKNSKQQHKADDAARREDQAPAYHVEGEKAGDERRVGVPVGSKVNLRHLQKACALTCSSANAALHLLHIHLLLQPSRISPGGQKIR